MNSRRHTITSLSIVFLAVTIMTVSVLGQSAYAGHGGGAGMSLSVDCSGSSCDISGTTDRNDQDVTMVITQANGNIVEIGQLGVDHGDFGATWNISSEVQDGTATVSVNQGASSKYSLSIDVEVSGGSSSSSDSVSNQVAASEEEVAGQAAADTR